MNADRKKGKTFDHKEDEETQRRCGYHPEVAPYSALRFADLELRASTALRGSQRHTAVRNHLPARPVHQEEEWL